MATKLFLRATASDISGSGKFLASLSQGSAKVASDATATATGPTAGVQVQKGAVNAVWFSNPLNAKTIAGTITFNLWGFESAAQANTGFDVLVERCDQAGNVLSTILRSERGTELATAAAVNNWTGAPTSTALSAGDRIKITVFGNDAGGTMASGRTFTLDYGAGTGVDGDSYVQVNEAVTELALVTVSASATCTPTLLRQGGKVISKTVTGAVSLLRLIGRALSLTGSGAASPPMTGLKLWVRADVDTWQDAGFTTAASADSDPVAGWKDQSGNANHVTQATSTKRPLLKLNIQNGLPALLFDGVDDYLINTSFTQNQPDMIFVVGRSLDGFGRFVDGQSTEQMVGNFGGGNLILYAGTVLSDGAMITVWQAISAIFNGANSFIYQNGSQVANGDAGASPLSQLSIGIGAGLANPLNGYVGEVLVYDSTSDRQNVENYLNRWFAAPGATGTPTKLVSFVKNVAVTAASTASLLRIHLVQKIVSATATGTASLLRLAQRILGLTSTGTVTLKRQTNRTFPATATGTSSILWTAVHYLAVTVASASVAVIINLVKRISTATGVGTPTRLIQAQRQLSATSTEAISLLKTAMRTLSKTATGSATVTASLSFLRNIAATSSAAASLQRQTSRIISATASGAVSLLKSIARLFSAISSGSPNITRQAQVSKVVTATGIPTRAGLITRVISLSASGASSIIKSIARLFSVTAAKTVTVTKQPQIIKTASATGAPTRILLLGKIITTTASGQSSLLKNISRVIATAATGLSSKLLQTQKRATTDSTASPSKLVTPGRIVSVGATATVALVRQVLRVMSVSAFGAVALIKRISISRPAGTVGAPSADATAGQSAFAVTATGAAIVIRGITRAVDTLATSSVSVVTKFHRKLRALVGDLFRVRGERGQSVAADDENITVRPDDESTKPS
jgi:hypothetical protein